MTAELWQPIMQTPVSELLVSLRGARHHLLIKHEGHNPSGSVKDRTAIGLLRSLDSIKPLRPGTVVVESTSGNLGIALAQTLMRLDCHLIAVIDPRTPAASARRLQAAGVSLHMVDEPDGHGGYLLSRLQVVRQICARNPEYRWTNQYESPANPTIHELTTGPEILQQGGPELDAVYVAVSVGGTLAGIARHIRGQGRFVRLIAVDVYSSLASGSFSAPPTSKPKIAAEDGPAGPDGEVGIGTGVRLVPGIGASLQSSFLGAGSFDRRIIVRDADAIAMCRILREDTALGVGGSTGCVLSACVGDLQTPIAPVRPLCLSADDATKYEDTIYNDGWLENTSLHDEVTATIKRLRIGGLAFEVTRPAY